MAVHCPYCQHSIDLKRVEARPLHGQMPEAKCAEVPAGHPHRTGERARAVSGMKSERLKVETVPAPPRTEIGPATLARAPEDTGLWSPDPPPAGDSDATLAALPGSQPSSSQDHEATLVQEPAVPSKDPARRWSTSRPYP